MSGGPETSRAMPYRTPLKRARGLGAGKSGTTHFWRQRVTAVVLAPLAIWFVATLVSLVGVDLETARGIIARPWNTIIFAVFLVSMFWHAKLGLQIVIEDYVHRRWLEITAHFLNNFLCGLGAVASLYAIARIAFAT